MAAHKKKAARPGAHLVFADESGFLLVPSLGKTWAPQGCTPVHRHRQSHREKISAISAVTVSPRRQRLGLYYQLFVDSIGQHEVCQFLRHLLRHLRGPLLVLLDNASMHRGKQLQAQGRHPRLHLEYFPSYAPELNPDEGVWSQAKRYLANTCPLDLDQLLQNVLDCLEHVRSSPRNLRACIVQSELPYFLR